MDFGLYQTVPEQDGNIVRLVEAIFSCALQRSASDIHIEPLETHCRIRIRVDGLLQELCLLPLTRHNAILSRIKLLGEMDIAEKRLPQDGRLEAGFQGRAIDFRISSLPTMTGEKLAIRILDKNKSLFSLSGLGFSETNKRLYEGLIRMENGLLLTCGPTGSGKSTTLYATLQEINTEDKNITSIEEPVEYKLPGINQVAVHRKIGLDFADGLRAIVRQDPNVIMLGEIRDLPSAEIAVQAAMTGHLVFSTLHTNSALGAIDRLIDLGVEPFVLLNSLRGVLAQRLVRRICPNCASERPATALEKYYLGSADRVSCGKGCSHCQGTGYKGRIAVHELLVMDDELVRLLLQHADKRTILGYLKEKDFHLLREDGLDKVKGGKTTVEELLRVNLLEGGSSC